MLMRFPCRKMRKIKGDPLAVSESYDIISFYLSCCFFIRWRVQSCFIHLSLCSRNFVFANQHFSPCPSTASRSVRRERERDDENDESINLNFYAARTTIYSREMVG